jgi:hypothetical protein
MITADLVRQVIAGSDALPDNDAGLPGLDTTAAVIAYHAATARADGEDEADACELIIRAAGMPPTEVRADAKLLHALGFVAVAQRMKEIAGRRAKTLKPLQ